MNQTRSWPTSNSEAGVNPNCEGFNVTKGVRCVAQFVIFFSGMYSCPCYYFPNRAGGSGRQSFVVAVDLKAGAGSSDHWVKRGTALLMSLDH